MKLSINPHNVKIFTIGAFLQPIEIKDSDGNSRWTWMVSSFEDSSYLNGKEYNPKEIACSLDDLLVDTTSE